MKDLFSIVQEAALLNGRCEDARYRLFEQHIAKTVAVAMALSRRLPEGILFDKEDFVMIGLQALWEITGRYNIAITDNFWGYAYSRITGSMMDEIRSSDPVSRKHRAMIRKIQNKRLEIEQQSGHTATFEEACSILDIDDEKRSELQEITSMYVISLDASPHTDRTGESEKASLAEIIADPNSIDPTASADRNDEIATLEKLLNRLEPMERSLIRLYFFSGLRLSDVAQAMGLTESRISQRLNLVLEKLGGFAKSDGISFHKQIAWE